MLAEASFVGFIPITDPAAARLFYEGRLGLSVIEETPFAVVLDANGTVIRLIPVSGFSPQPFTAGGWLVPDAGATVRALAGRGVVFLRYEGMDQDDLGIWTSPSGALVVWFADPDGNTLSITSDTTR